MSRHPRDILGARDLGQVPTAAEEQMQSARDDQRAIASVREYLETMMISAAAQNGTDDSTNTMVRTIVDRGLAMIASHLNPPAGMDADSYFSALSTKEINRITRSMRDVMAIAEMPARRAIDVGKALAQVIGASKAPVGDSAVHIIRPALALPDDA